MEAIKLNNFDELSQNEMMEVDGGTFDPVSGGIAFVALCGAALVGGFKAGRAFMRDLCKKYGW